MRRSPKLFRWDVAVGEGGAKAKWEAWQERDFAALEGAWLRLAGQSGRASCQRAYLERPRGHSKTTDTAVQLAWILQFSPRRLEGLAAAADLDQGRLIRDAIERLARGNPELCADLEFRQQQVRNRVTGSRLSVISSDVQSSWGLLPDFVVCDELSHWEKPDLWYSLLSSAAKKPECVVLVLTNAGVGRGWQWEVREAARHSPRWHFSSLEGCQAPWISAEWLDEQRLMLPEGVFDRLWNNRWQSAEGGFVRLEEAEACRDERLSCQEEGLPGVRYFAAIDFAEKHDYTVGVVVHWSGAELVVDRMDVVCPTPDEPVRVEWVERWIENVASRFGAVRFVVDEYQLLSVIQKYESRVELGRFAFLAGQGNHALALNLRQLILERRLKWYSGCGQLAGVAVRDDLETELAAVVLRQSSGGRVRIDHLRKRTAHDDRVFALGVAALEAMKDEGKEDWLDVQEPGESGGWRW